MREPADACCSTTSVRMDDTREDEGISNVQIRKV